MNGKTSKFVDAGGYNRNKGEKIWRFGVGQEGVKKENKTLGTERSKNIKNQYINKILQ